MENSLDNNKKHIKFIATVGNKKNIIEELEKRAEKPTIPENSAELKQQLDGFKDRFNDENYHNSDVFAENMKNKTGKYIVVCMDTKHMYEMIRKTHELFDKVNTNINVSYIGSRMYESVQQEIIQSFDQLESDGKALNILFLNKATTRYYDAHNVDGVILFAYARYHTNRNLAIVEEALKSCKDNGLVIQVVDSIDTMSKYLTLQQRVNENGKYIVDFTKSDSFTVAENFRDATYSKKIDDNFKLKIMKEYKEKTGKNITIDTVYKGYYLGSWKSNLRQSYNNGELDMDDELIKKFEEEGILGDRLRRYHTSDLDKYNLLLQFNKENPDIEIKTDTVDGYGNPIGYYRGWLQVRVNKKTSNLSQKQISDLRKLGYLNLSPNEVKELSKEFKIPEIYIVNIIKEYRSIEKFIYKYKTGNVNPENMKLNKRGIVLSKNELTMKQKQAYITLVQDIYGKNALEKSGKFIIEEEILEAINKLPDKRKKIIIERYGLNGNEPKTYKEIGEEFNSSRQYAKNLEVTALKHLSKNISIYSKDELIKSKEKLTAKLEEVEEVSFDEWKKRKLSCDLKQLKLTETSIEKLNISGYYTIGDLVGISKEELSKIPGFGYRKVYDLMKSITSITSTMTPKKKQEEDRKTIQKLIDKLNPINEKLEAFKKAHDYYMNKENIFNQDEIIPPSIVGTTFSKLEQKKNEKASKQEILNSLVDEVRLQDKKTDKIALAFGKTDIITEEKDN